MNNESLIRNTIEFFQPFYDEQLSRDDALEIIQTLRDYSRALLAIKYDKELNNVSSGD